LARLPDGIRETDASHVLIELKYTESVNEDAMCQTAGYYKFYKTCAKLKDHEIQCFLISSKTPLSSTRREFAYEPSELRGVYKSRYPVFRLFPLISLNDLSDEPHNILFKLFASKKKEVLAAERTVRTRLMSELPRELRDFINEFFRKALAKGGCMDYLNITPEERQAMRREWLEMFRSELSPEERMAGLGPH